MTILKMQRKTLGINGGGRNDDFEIRPLWQQLPQIAEQKIDIQRTLMRLVNDDGVVGIQEFVTLRFGEQNAVGHQLDETVLRTFLGEAHLEADALAHLLAQLFGDARGHAAGGDPARLGVTDQAVTSSSGRQRNLRQLGRFAGPGFAGEHHNLMVSNQ